MYDMYDMYNMYVVYVMYVMYVMYCTEYIPSMIPTITFLEEMKKEMKKVKEKEEEEKNLLRRTENPPSPPLFFSVLFLSASLHYENEGPPIHYSPQPTLHSLSKPPTPKWLVNSDGQ